MWRPKPLSTERGQRQEACSFCLYMSDNKVSLSGLLCISSINNERSKEQGQKHLDSEEKCFAWETIWCTEHALKLGKLSPGTRWWIVSSYRQGTVEISNRKESGGRRCLCGGVAHHSFLYSKRWWSLLRCWWYKVLYKLHCLPAPVGILAE